ncbi:MAG TPA: cytochrome c peroxidase [Burkholderiaceae bacterium]|jgi:cytochrome c peroxidase
MPVLGKAFAAAAASALLLCACGGSDTVGALSPYAALGEKIFNDKNLSSSGAQACSTCHNPNNAHAQINDLAVQLGGQNLDQHGFRAPPSLNYLEHVPAFSFDAAFNPLGGFDLDGRAATLADQPQSPLLAPFEMGNADKAQVIARLQSSNYANDFRAAFGSGIFESQDQAFADLSFALQQYQIEDASFHPYDSKYDQYLAGKVTLTSAEAHGLALFNDPQKGNCNACHSSAPGAYGAPPQFTNYRYVAIGVPRNQAIPANANAAYFDLGACGPYRTDLSQRRDLCGAFRVPSLRNVATRKVFFHNGRFDNLTTAVTFLLQRDTNPEAWYPNNAAGIVQKFDDLPETARANVDVGDAPFNRRPGMAPALSPAEIADLVLFLGTLTDGYVP